MKQFSIFFRYIKHVLGSGSRKGHGIHSPFLFAFAEAVLAVKKSGELPVALSELYKKVYHDRERIDCGNFGAGSQVAANQIRTVNHIARNSSVSLKWGALLYRLVKWYKPAVVIELGTGLGISTACLAAGGDMKVISVEASPGKLRYAEKVMDDLGLSHVELINGLFDDVLPELLSGSSGRAIFFIDGNHTCEATLRYADMIMALEPEECLLVFDDINWSDGMFRAWSMLKKDERVRVTVDLFFMGILIIRPQMQKADLKFVF